jgi:hypothetical protein
VGTIALGVLGTIQYFSFHKICLLLYSIKRHRVHTSAQVRLRVLSVSPLKLMLQIMRQQKFGRRIGTPPSDYVLSCPCNNETPRSRKPLQQGG